MKGKEQILKQFGKKLRAKREAKDLTQMDIAHEIDSNPAYISKLENGRAEPGLLMILSLERTLGCKPGELWAD